MLVNPWVYAVFALGSAAGVFVHAKKRRAREIDGAAGDREAQPGGDDWDYASPGPTRWTLAAALLAPVALPAYLLRCRQWKPAAAAMVVAVAAIAATLTVKPTFEIRSPFKQAKTVPWSKFPPGLAESVRKATEQLSVDLATKVIEALPGMIAVGRSYPGGAEISVKPDKTEARLLIQINSDEYIIKAVLRIFAAREASGQALGKETGAAGWRELALAGGRRGKVLGPNPQPEGGQGSKHVVELYDQRGGVLTHLIVQEKSVSEAAFTASRRAGLEKEVTGLADKIARQVNLSD